MATFIRFGGAPTYRKPSLAGQGHVLGEIRSMRALSYIQSIDILSAFESAETKLFPNLSFRREWRRGVGEMEGSKQITSLNKAFAFYQKCCVGLSLQPDDSDSPCLPRDKLALKPFFLFLLYSL